MAIWNPWHGCHKKSAGCLNCYMFRRDSMYDKDSTIVTKTKDFNLGIKKHKDGSYFIKSGETVYTCMTSDFFIEEADNWRNNIWQIIKYRKDLHFVIITKRIERFLDCIPEDWEEGYPNVTICATCENQQMADESGKIEHVTCGGESGDKARPCNYDWILNTRDQCIKTNTSFYFKQTGANFIKDNKHYNIKRYNQMKQANKANINYLNK